MAAMATGASLATSICTAGSALNQPAPRVNTSHTAAASSRPSLAPLLGSGKGKCAGGGEG